MEKQEHILYWMLTGILAAMVAAALLIEGFGPSVEGFLWIQSHPARLINDFTEVGSPGGALLNSASVAAIALLMIRFIDVRLSGPTIAAFFTVMGFGLFGKTPLNILPVIFGVWVSARIAGKSNKEYILIALFGTALGPLASFAAVEAGIAGAAAIPVAAAAGIAAGMLLPPAAMAMLHLHQGYNLYNIGLTSGFVGLFAAGIIRASGGDPVINVIWGTTPSPLLWWAIPVLCLYLIVFALVLSPKGLKQDFLEIQQATGRLPSDFMDMVSNGGALLNTGLLGLLSWGYVLLIGGALNGPVLGGILTVMGFGVFGKHLRNCIPIVIGVVLSCLLFGKDLAAPGPILAALFATTLAPIAGEFGIIAGIIGGFIHLIMVEQTAAWHGGVDLYNNGFAGGLTAALIYAVIEWYRSSRPDPHPFGSSKQ